MKNNVLTFIATVFLLCNNSVFAQQNKSPKIIYTGIINIVPNEFNFPLIGLVNIANGNFNTLQLGLINHIHQVHHGFQLGFINSSSGLADGLQMGFVNHCNDDIIGTQIGFVNIVEKNTDGVTLGFVNISGGEVEGGQFGFVNSSNKYLTGTQLGFVNNASDSVQGVQFGFVNVADNAFNGAQVAFVNSAKTVKGFKFGFVNVCDTVADGLPFGFVSIVKNGGYQAFGIFADEYNPVNISFRIGIRKFYTTVIASYNNEKSNSFSFGGGFGTIIPFSERYFFNPELISHSSEWSSDDYRQLSILSMGFGFNASEDIQFSIGPSITWTSSSRVSGFSKPIFQLPDFSFNRFNLMNLGFRAGINISL